MKFTFSFVKNAECLLDFGLEYLRELTVILRREMDSIGFHILAKIVIIVVRITKDACQYCMGVYLVT